MEYTRAPLAKPSSSYSTTKKTIWLFRGEIIKNKDSDEDLEVSDILDFIKTNNDSFLYSDDENNYLFDVSEAKEYIVIKLQKLKDKELPEIADKKSGKNPEPLKLPDDKALLFENCIVYHKAKKVFAMARLSERPQNRIFCQMIAEMYLQIDQRKVRFRLCAILKNDLRKKLIEAKTISELEFSSSTFYNENETVKQGRDFTKYEDFMSHDANVEKEVKLKGKNGANLRKRLEFMIDDFIEDNMPTLKKFKLKLDGEELNLMRYFYKNEIDIVLDPGNQRNILLKDLEDKLKQELENYVDPRRV